MFLNPKKQKMLPLSANIFLYSCYFSEIFIKRYFESYTELSVDFGHLNICVAEKLVL